MDAELLHGTYHEKFRCMRVGQGWIVKRGRDLYLKVVFSKEINIPDLDGEALAVDINENNVTFGTMNRVETVETGERVIRTAYFLKRRKV